LRRFLVLSLLKDDDAQRSTSPRATASAKRRQAAGSFSAAIAGLP